METWDKLPLNVMDELAEREGYRRDVYRPIYSLHKWWARRPGSTFRILSLAAFTENDVTKDDILRKNSSGRFEGLYLQNQEGKFEDITVLDPFSGGGTTLVETNRLGAKSIGYELNPVAWWTIKKSIDDINLDKFKSEFDSLLTDVREEIGEYLLTENPETGNECEILYSFLSQKIPCLTCDEEVNLFSRYTLAKKKSTAPAAIYCPNTGCESPVIELSREIKNEETCPSCGHQFDPSDGNYGYGKYTCSEGHKHDVKETLQRLDEKPNFDYFAIQYETKRGKKKYKRPDENDLEKISKTSKLVSGSDDLIYPEQRIPKGDKTQALLNYNYSHFHDLFTDRQLFLFSKLFERAMEVDDKNTRDYLVTVISNALNFASTLCRWHVGNQKGLDVFERHAYAPKIQPVEPNPLNSAGTLSSLENAFGRVYDAKEYCKRPFEKLKEKGSVNQYYIQDESISEDRLLDLKSKTSENIDFSDTDVDSVDYVITDPPYYDNVQYSELSDFFYVWLRECLKDDYREFEPELVPKAREIVANNSAGKDEEFFIESLSNVFSESYRVLKDEGELIFTYHHNENEAWSVILRALIESGFTIAGAYPVQSERSNSTHISDLDNSEYDILIFANKEDANEEITLSELRQNLFFELQGMIAEEQERHSELGLADLGVILRGKCMYYYSKHYPHVYSEGEKVDINTALNTVDSVIEQILEGSVNLPQSIDQLTQSYAAFYQRGAEDYDELNKHLLAKNLNVSDLENEKLVKGPRNKKKPVTADERINYIEGKLNQNGKGADSLLDIDKIHYLYHLYKSDQNTVEYLKEWKTDDLQTLADFMADVTDDERYENVMDMGLQQF